jgi:hypothetical protein
VKNINKNPIVWSIVVVILGYVAITKDEMDFFIVLALAVIIEKLIEIINGLVRD